MADIQKTVLDAATSRQSYYHDRDAAMDRWLAHYWLIDWTQMQKPPGETKYVSPYPQTVVDRSVQILTRNPVHMHVVYGREQEEERETIHKVEQFGIGLFNDINDSLRDRLEQRAEQAAAWYALVRGWICSEIWITKESGREDSPVWFNHWDPRFVYPRRDRKGLHSVLYVQDVTVAEMLEDYPDSEAEVDTKFDLEAIVKKHIWWDRENYAVVADWQPRRGRRKQMVLQHSQHGLDQIPVVMVPANGAPVKTIPALLGRGHQDERNTGFWLPPGHERSDGQRAWTAMQGRSIFATVEQAIPQLNQTTATMLHAMNLAAFPTIKVFTRDGDEKEVSFGTAVVNTFSRQAGEDMEIIPSGGMPPGAESVYGLLRSDLFASMLPQALLDQTMATSGFDRSQIINVALNALGSFSDALDDWQERVVQSALRQIQDYDEPVTVSGASPDQRKTFFTVTFEPGEIQRKYVIRVERTPSLPDDMVLRAQLAAQLTNPARPLMSLQTVLDVILKVDDVKGELDKMFEDLAMLHPAVVAKRLEKVLVDRGQFDLLPYVQDEATIQAIIQQIQKATAQGQLAALSIPGQAGVAPQNGPPEQMSPATETGRGMGPMPVMPMNGGY